MLRTNPKLFAISSTTSTTLRPSSPFQAPCAYFQSRRFPSLTRRQEGSNVLRRVRLLSLQTPLCLTQTRDQVLLLTIKMRSHPLSCCSAVVWTSGGASILPVTGNQCYEPPRMNFHVLHSDLEAPLSTARLGRAPFAMLPSRVH